MNSYIVYDTDPEYGACLVFAKTAHRAKYMGWSRCLSGFPGDCEYIHARARRILLGFPLKELNDGTEKVIESPQSCTNCGLWGGHVMKLENIALQDDNSTKLFSSPVLLAGQIITECSEC